jgi:hypothetical protein
MKPEDFSDEPTQAGVEIKGGPAALRPYLGQVVAVVAGEVRASGKTWGDCLRAADDAHLVDPELLYVPSGAFVG